jgi:3',5'-cyclic AMP phosphodiesterase CpdA
MDNPIRIVHFSDTHFTSRPQFIEDSFNASVNVINSTPHDFAI